MQYDMPPFLIYTVQGQKSRRSPKKLWPAPADAGRRRVRAKWREIRVDGPTDRGITKKPRAAESFEQKRFRNARNAERT